MPAIVVWIPIKIVVRSKQGPRLETARHGRKGLWIRILWGFQQAATTIQEQEASLGSKKLMADGAWR